MARSLLIVLALGLALLRADASAADHRLLVEISPDGPPQTTPFDPTLQIGSPDIPVDDPRVAKASPGCVAAEQVSPSGGGLPGAAKLGRTPPGMRGSRAAATSGGRGYRQPCGTELAVRARARLCWAWCHLAPRTWCHPAAPGVTPFAHRDRVTLST